MQLPYNMFDRVAKGRAIPSLPLVYVPAYDETQDTRPCMQATT